MTLLRAGLFGFPLSHSRAHQLYQHWISRYHIDGSYELVAVNKEGFEAKIRQLAGEGWRGGSVTMPHKETALAIADRASDRALAIGSSNTLVFDNGEVFADNFDGVGFIQSVRDTAGAQFDPDRPVLVFGAGGAARAVLHALLEEGVPEIRLVNRTQQRADNLAGRFGANVKVIEWHNAEKVMRGAGTIVNTTSMGMSGNPPLPFKLDHADDDAIAADIVVTPQQTPFIQHAQERELTVVKGLGMLLHQAPPGFEAWYGVRPEVDDAIRDEMLSALGTGNTS